MSTPVTCPGHEVVEVRLGGGGGGGAEPSVRVLGQGEQLVCLQVVLHLPVQDLLHHPGAGGEQRDWPPVLDLPEVALLG